jgi:hypothetical protein
MRWLPKAAIFALLYTAAKAEDGSLIAAIITVPTTDGAIAALIVSFDLPKG